MPTVPLMITTLVTTLLVGGAATAWLWRVYRQRLVVTAGLRTLAAMRWREFSRFVVESLQTQGFSASRMRPDGERGQHADLLLTRHDQVWLLSCKQGVNYRINAAMVDQLARAVRDSGASGGVLATLGRISPSARKDADGIELIDGATLWTLIDPQLPPSLHLDLKNGARTQTIRATVLVWVVALVLGFGVAGVMSTLSSGNGDGDTPVLPTAPMAKVSSQAPPAVTDAPQPPSSTMTSPGSIEDDPGQRSEAAKEVSALTGIDRAAWVTQSTLLIRLELEADTEQVERICTTLQRNGVPNARLQLEPPPGSEAPVRFLQCLANY